MLRLHLTRIIKLLTLPWLTLCGLWLFLPSPQRSTQSRAEYINTRLRTGRTVITVHEWERWRDALVSDENRDAVLDVRWSTFPRPDDGCTGLILDWRIEGDGDRTVLRVGDWGRLDLSDVLVRAVERSKKAGGGGGGDGVGFQPYVSDAVRVRVNVGDRNALVNMPWFAYADQVVFHHEMHGFDYELGLRLFVPAPDTVEVWKDVDALWKGFPATTIREGDRLVARLLTVKGLLNVKGSRARLGFLKVENVSGLLTSRTFPVRWVLLGPAGLFASLGMGLVRLAVEKVAEEVSVWVLVGFGVLVVGLVVLRWYLLWKRRNEIKAKKQIWGPAGPIYDFSHDDDYDPARWRGKKEVSMGSRLKHVLFDGVGDKARKKKAGGRFGV